ncbi:MAG: sugar phosphate isomerase/epimerase [Chloroflexi bacterium]|nr:sugar phosphate isomerase/epimerase [Chloroflexota bacterium]
MTAQPSHPSHPSHPAVALSTMWAVQPRFERDLRAFMERAAELGYEAVEINHSMDAAQIGAILGHGVLPITNVHAPAPLERHPSLGWNRELDLAAEDEQERAAAVDYTKRSVDCAVEAGAGAVVVHLGAVSRHAINGDRRLRAGYPEHSAAYAKHSAAQAESSAAHAERSAAHAESSAAATLNPARDSAIVEALRDRSQLAPAALDRAGRSLEELVRYAQPHGVALGLECRLHFHEIPLPHEAAELLAPYPPEVAGYWHDVGHAEVLHRLGLVERSAWFDLLGERVLGVHISDVAGLRDHRAPGRGDVDYRWLAARLPAQAARTLEIDQREPDEAVQAALTVLREASVIGGAPAPG